MFVGPHLHTQIKPQFLFFASFHFMNLFMSIFIQMINFQFDGLYACIYHLLVIFIKMVKYNISLIISPEFSKWRCANQFIITLPEFSYYYCLNFFSIVHFKRYKHIYELFFLFVCLFPVQENAEQGADAPF